MAADMRQRLFASLLTQVFLLFHFISPLLSALLCTEKVLCFFTFQDIAFFDEHKTGELISRLTTDIQDFKSSFKSCISQGVTQTVRKLCHRHSILSMDSMILQSPFYFLVQPAGFRSLAQALGCIVSLYTISPQLTGLMGTVIPALVLIGSYIGSGLRRLSKNAQNQV